MKKQLYPEQVAHAALLAKSIERNNHALDGSSTGCGKTLVASALAAQYRRPTFVVGLKSTLPMWEQEMKEQGWPALGVLNYEKLRRGSAKWGDWIRKGQWQWNLPKNAIIVWDEFQNCQGVDTLNSKMLIAAKPFTNILLSATGAEDPTDMRASGFILGLHGLRDYWAWCRKNGCTPNQWGGLEFEGGDEVMDAIHKYIFPNHGSRLTLEDMKAHFTETQIITTPLEFGEEIEKIYAEMEKEIAKLEEIMTSDSDHPAAQALIEKLRARQRVEFLKVPTMIEMAGDLIKEGRSVVIFVNFQESINAIRERFPGSLEISGRVTGKPRQDAIAAFQENRCKLLVCNSQAGGVSLSLHDLDGSHPRTAIISPDWNAKRILQVLGRVHRAGGKSNTQQHVLFAAGTVEVQVEKAVRRGMERIGIFNDGLKNDYEDGNSVIIAPPPTPKIIIPVPTATPNVALSEKVVCFSDNSVAFNLPLRDNKPTMTEEKPVPAESLEEPAHAEFSPSSLSMFEKCPGWRNRNETTPQAEAGTRIHKALETDAIDSLPNDDEKAVAQSCKDFMDSLIAERGVPDTDHREVRLYIDLGGNLKTFGTCDRLMTWGKLGILTDYKSGYRLVADAEENAQGWSYIIGTFQRPDMAHLEEVIIYFLIPNRDEISSAMFKRSQIPAMQLRLNTIVRRAMADNEKQYNPQPELCEYCNKQETCPALALKALMISKHIAAGLPVPTNASVSKDRPKDIPHLLRLAPLMEAWATGVRKEALRLQMQEGIEVAGFKRIERSNPRSVNSVMGTWKVIKDKGVSLEDFLDACGSVSIPSLEELVASLAERGQKGPAAKQFINALRSADILNEGGKSFYLKEQKK